MMRYHRRIPTREVLVTPHERSNVFIPTFAVRRHVSLETAQEIHKSLGNRIEEAAQDKKISQKLKKHCEIVDPKRMCVTLIERGRMKEGITTPPSSELTEQMLKLTVALHGLLQQKTAASGSINFEIGAVDRFGYDSPKRTIGAALKGWRGPRAHYNICDNEGNPVPTAVIKAEKEVCLSALADRVQVTEDFSQRTMAQTPHLSLVSNRRGFRNHEFRALEPVIVAALPPEIPLQDPAIYLHTAPGSKQPREIMVTPEFAAEVFASTRTLSSKRYSEPLAFEVLDEIVPDGIDPYVMDIERYFAVAAA